MAFDNSAFTEPQSATDKALVFELSGHEVGWLADALAIKRASERGHALGDILEELEDLKAIYEAESATEAANAYGDSYSAVARLVWLGMLRFSEDVSYDAIFSSLDLDALSDLPVGEMLQRAFPSADPETEEAAEDTEGKPNGGG